MSYPPAGMPVSEPSASRLRVEESSGAYFSVENLSPVAEALNAATGSHSRSSAHRSSPAGRNNGIGYHPKTTSSTATSAAVPSVCSSRIDAAHKRIGNRRPSAGRFLRSSCMASLVAHRRPSVVAADPIVFQPRLAVDSNPLAFASNRSVVARRWKPRAGFATCPLAIPNLRSGGVVARSSSHPPERSAVVAVWRRAPGRRSTVSASATAFLESAPVPLSLPAWAEAASAWIS